MGGMTHTAATLLAEIEAFLAESGMGESYFGKRASGNSELVARLRQNRRVWPETADKVLSFINDRRAVLNGGHGNAPAASQGEHSGTDAGEAA
jgi:hypothetical protein